MKNNISRNIAAMLCVVAFGTNVAVSYAAPPQIRLQYFVITAATSPSNSVCQQNVMSYMDKDGVVGYISTDVANDPAALNMPCSLRACDLICSVASYKMWDATNSPSGPFADQNGKRFAIVGDWKDSTAFYATNIWFALDSNDSAHTLRYNGNIAVDASSGTNLTFSPTLRGELWDASGNVIATYYKGESTATHMVNRVIGMVRLGWLCGSSTDVVGDLNYFRGHMTMILTSAIYMPDGPGRTNQISSQPCLIANGAPAGSNIKITIQGQRQIPAVSYGMKRTLSLGDTNQHWTVIVPGGLADSSIYLGTPANTSDSDQAYYRAFEVNNYIPSALMNVVVQPETMLPTIKPVLHIENGSE